MRVNLELYDLRSDDLENLSDDKTLINDPVIRVIFEPGAINSREFILTSR